MPTPRATTILDVAREAGVSRQTVTRALNDMADIAPATRERVIAAARTLGYRPNRAAQSLVRGAEVTVGLLVESLRNPYYSELASELSRAAASRGWGLILCDVGYEHTDAIGQRLAPLLRRVDVVVGRVPAGSTSHLDIPSVSIDDPDDTLSGAAVTIDHAAGVEAAMRHLVEQGHENIAMIDSGPVPSPRCLAYRAALEEAGLPWSPRSEVRVEESHAGGVAAAAELLARGTAVDAVLAFNDVLAIGALKELAGNGRRVPDDVAVVGMDGLDLGGLITPELTTVATDRAVIAAAALDLVAVLLDGSPGAEVHRRTITPQLLVRASG